MGYKISYYDHEDHKLKWRDDATLAEWEEWKAKRAVKSARTRTTPKQGKTVDSEPLEDSGSPPEPTGPKRKGGANTRPESALAPALPRMAQAIAQLAYNGSHSVTGGRAPLTQQEASYIAIPAVRIIDRTAAKYAKTTGVVTPNQEDAAIIVVTVAMWLLGWLIAVLTKKPRTADSAPRVTSVSNIPPQAAHDLFSGSEPVDLHGRPVAPAAANPAGAPDMPEIDDGDLFTGSEPLAADASAPQMPARQTVDPRRGAMADALWAAISPTDRGEALAG